MSVGRYDDSERDFAAGKVLNNSCFHANSHGTPRIGDRSFGRRSGPQQPPPSPSDIDKDWTESGSVTILNNAVGATLPWLPSVSGGRSKWALTEIGLSLYLALSRISFQEWKKDFVRNRY
jgi:hypothetical protein